jgi:hypothetical protein
MSGDVGDGARRRLSALAGDPSAHQGLARHLEQDAALVGRLLAAACGVRDGDGQAPDVTADDMGAGLSLFEDMRLALDRLEVQVVLEARRRGMDWRQIALHQGLNSSQAASQRYQRLVTRLEEIRQGIR